MQRVVDNIGNGENSVIQDIRKVASMHSGFTTGSTFSKGHSSVFHKSNIRLYGKFSLRLIGSAMFGATFITWLQVTECRNFWNTER